MIVQGGVFDKIHDETELAALCGAKWIRQDGAMGVWFPVLGKLDVPAGELVYQRYQAKEGGPKCYTAQEQCYTADIHEAETTADDGEAQIGTKEYKKGDKIEVLDFDISQGLIDAAEDGDGSEQGTPRSIDFKCPTCHKLVSDSYIDGRARLEEKCTCDNMDPFNFESENRSGDEGDDEDEEEEPNDKKLLNKY